jgi:hypothetical protein
VKFNRNDLDQEFLHARTEDEAKQIFNKESTRQGRTYEQVYQTCLYGQTAECYLIQFQKFKDDPRPYKDVFTPVGKPAEIKVTEGDYYVDYVIERCEKYAKEKWRQYPSIVYVFIGNKSSLEYNLYGVYHWNGKNFIKE